MKKNSNFKKAVDDFLVMDESKRNELFKRDLRHLPSIESRAKFFMALPVEESSRLLSEIKSIEMDHFMFDRIFESPENEPFIFNDLLPKLSSSRLTGLVFKTGPFMHINILFDLLPIQTVVSLIDEAVNKTKEHDAKLFEVISRIQYTSLENLNIIFSKIKLESVKKIFSYSFGGFGQPERKKMLDCISGLNENKIIKDLCITLGIKVSPLILTRIKDPLKQKKVLRLLPQNHKNAFFSRTSKSNNKVLKSRDIDVTKIGLEKKKDFFKQFPKINQVNKLTLTERIEIFGSVG